MLIQTDEAFIDPVHNTIEDKPLFSDEEQRESSFSLPVSKDRYRINPTVHSSLNDNATMDDAEMSHSKRSKANLLNE